jgi:hypothetical protein
LDDELELVLLEEFELLLLELFEDVLELLLPDEFEDVLELLLLTDCSSDVPWSRRAASNPAPGAAPASVVPKAAAMAAAAATVVTVMRFMRVSPVLRLLCARVRAGR